MGYWIFNSVFISTCIFFNSFTLCKIQFFWRLFSDVLFHFILLCIWLFLDTTHAAIATLLNLKMRCLLFTSLNYLNSLRTFMTVILSYLSLGLSRWFSLKNISIGLMALKEKIYWPDYLVAFSFLILTRHVDSFLGCVSTWDPNLFQSWLVWGGCESRDSLGNVEMPLLGLFLGILMEKTGLWGRRGKHNRVWSAGTLSGECWWERYASKVCLVVQQ